MVTTMGADTNPRFGWPVCLPRRGSGRACRRRDGQGVRPSPLVSPSHQPDRNVLILDGDGSLVMNLGTLTTISETAPSNLYHFVFENGCYAVTGGQPIPADGKVSFKEMAAGAGYVAAYEFDEALEDRGKRHRGYSPEAGAYHG